MDTLSANEALKLQNLQARVAQAKFAIEEGNTADGDAFFDALESGVSIDAAISLNV